MPRLRAPTRLTHALEHAHQLAGSASAEDDTSAFLASTSHPLAGEYREARAFFDTLTHHGPNGQRYFAYADERNHILVSPPRLTISWYPRGFPGFGSVVLPSSPEWRDYLQDAAAAGFPPTCGPNGHLGVWDVRVEDSVAEAALAAVLRAHEISWRPVGRAASLRCFQLDRFEKVRAALTEACADWILPPRDTMQPAPVEDPPSAAAPTTQPPTERPCPPDAQTSLL